MSTPSQVLGDLIDALINGGDGNHSFLIRLSTAIWGSFVMHLAMIARSSALIESTPDIPAEVYFAIVFVFLIYCGVFGLMVAVGDVRGSIVRHFLLGAFLPAFAYSLARLATI